MIRNFLNAAFDYGVDCQQKDLCKTAHEFQNILNILWIHLWEQSVKSSSRATELHADRKPKVLRNNPRNMWFKFEFEFELIARSHSEELKIVFRTLLESEPKWVSGLIHIEDDPNDHYSFCIMWTSFKPSMFQFFIVCNWNILQSRKRFPIELWMDQLVRLRLHVTHSYWSCYIEICWSILSGSSTVFTLKVS